MSAPATWPGGAPLFHVLAKPTGARCNLDCAYCYYLEREALYPGARLRMTDDVLDLYLGQMMAAYQHADTVPIAWQGGEPTLMGLPFFQRATAKIKALLRPGQRVEHSLQTNGLLLDEAWCAFLREEQILVGLSLDGPPALHDASRVDKAGQGTAERAWAAARLLAREGVAVNAMVTVQGSNQKHPLEVYRTLRDTLGFRYFQFIPVVHSRAGGTAPVDPVAWGRFLTAVFDLWIREDVGRVFVINFEAALASWLGLDPAPCVYRRTCGGAVALEHNGDVYSCDHYVDPQHLLGNLRDRPLVELVGLPQQVAFGQAKETGLSAQCRACPVLFACRGECPKNRVSRTEDGEALNWLCAGYKAFYTHIGPDMTRLAALVRDGRPAENVMALNRALLEGLDRHAPCPCGGGRKWRRCHGAET